ncbi:hypothetical protein [Paragemmobacter ruber]|uniref:Lipoprotein n=1 Tax=Paragemmobacter ruber TaxID=1985673 RepID=A0ABW9Y314_9RHOB|nr:hypothetical protein [Rhodobacter ruber]NBE06337.1 hypothetical protein [Rhodobacter ruber]
MNGASKILTVSYGTFSCTLEGFDDPFNTMKAIAEYFRDLAAGDRYFGAEPPTPDAAMLHQIAEREIQRRVEAKIQENGVVLRASEQGADMPAPQVAAPAVAEPPAPRVTIPAVVAEVPVAPASTVAPTVAPAVAAVAAPAAESVVEKLSRLRSEIAAQPVVAPAQTVPVVSLALPAYGEDQEADTLDAGALADFLPEDMGVGSADLRDEAGYAAAEAADDLYDVPVVEDAPVAQMLTEVPMAAEEEAILLATVEDAVAPLPMETAADEAADEAEIDLSAVLEGVAAEAPAALLEDAAEEAAVEDLSETLRAALAEGPASEVVPEGMPGMATDAEVALSEALAVDAYAAPYEDAPAEGIDTEALLARVTLADETPAPAAAELTPDADDVSIWAETELADAVEIDPAQGGAASDAPGMDEVAEAAPAPEAAVAEPVPGIELRPGAAEKLQRARARVIRIRRGDDAAVALEQAATRKDESAASVAEPAAMDGTAPEMSAAMVVPEKAVDPLDPAETAATAPLLSPEDEAELQRELAALRRSEEERDAAEAAALAYQSEGRRVFDGPSADEALGRLMQQTASEMEGTETKRRQSAIQHLKAAVAATVADRKVTGEKAGETETVSRLARYRNDLAMAVKAALPGRGAAAAPQGERPAPLVLVSEQRIDRPRPAAAPTATATPIRPRRVTPAGLGMTAAAAGMDLSDEDEDDEDLSNVFDDSKGFVEFVERVGATGFEQILEASAAYIAGIEGRAHFSRPQLMRHLTAVIPPGSFQREDGLRSFGTLLRDGRIAKVRRGQFTLTEESAYLAEARKLAQ